MVRHLANQCGYSSGKAGQIMLDKRTKLLTLVLIGNHWSLRDRRVTKPDLLSFKRFICLVCKICTMGASMENHHKVL